MLRPNSQTSRTPAFQNLSNTSLLEYRNSILRLEGAEFDEETSIFQTVSLEGVSIKESTNGVHSRQEALSRVFPLEVKGRASRRG
jgi:hypothetical protein